MKEYFVIRKLVNENKFEEAIKKAESVKDKQEKAMLLCTIAEAMIYENREENAISLLNDALKTAREIEEKLFQSLAIGRISFTMAIAGEAEKAIEMARSITYNSEKVYAMVRISDVLANENEIEKILKEAEKVLDKIQDGIGKFLSIRDLAYAFIGIGEKDKALNLLKYAENMAENMDEENASAVFNLIAQMMMELGRVDDAMKLIEKIGNEYDKAWLMSDIAYERADAGLLEEAVKIARQMKYKYEAVSVLSKIVLMMSKFKKMSKFGRSQDAAKLINEMVKISEGIEEGMEKAMTLSLISHAMFEDGDKRYENVLNNAVEISKKLEGFGREEACSLIARVMIEIGKLEDALNFINEIDGKEVKGAVYISIVNELIYEGMGEEAMKIAEFIDDKILKERARREVLKR